MKVQVFGAYGMLGTAVINALKAGQLPYLAERSDITELRKENIRADIVINCAGILKQRNESPERYLLVNGYGPHLLSQLCTLQSTQLIHISTDCVFQGQGPHKETDVPDAKDIYGYSKIIGEINEAPHITLRTSFIGYGPYGLVHDLQTLENIKASTNLLWTGNLVGVTADLILALIQHNAYKSLSGILHMPGCEMNRLELCRQLVEHIRLNTRIIRDDSFFADRRLDASRWLGMGLPQPPSFREQLRGWN